MDIFTTYLTKVQRTPIKPAKLKVKALVKDASSSALTDDTDHLENHDYYFTSKNAHDGSSESQSARNNEEEQNSSNTIITKTQMIEREHNSKNKHDNESDDEHTLDVYV